MVLQAGYYEQVGAAVRLSGEGDRGRVDSDERILGSAIQYGRIYDVIDKIGGIISVQIDNRVFVTAQIADYYYPVPRPSDPVLITHSITGKRLARPTEPKLPPTFAGVVRIAADSRATNTAEHGAVVEHRFDVPPVGDFGMRRVPVIGCAGVNLREAGLQSDQVVCVIGYRYLVGVNPDEEQLIYAIANIPRGGDS